MPCEGFSVISRVAKFGIVGCANNLGWYITYIVLTSLWLPPYATVSILYPLSAITGYVGQSRYAFLDANRSSKAFLRYALAHAAGYLANILLLLRLSGRYGLPHWLVQLIAVGIVGALLYLLMRYYVFPTSEIDKSMTAKKLTRQQAHIRSTNGL